MESTDDFWWFWTAFDPITEATDITCSLRQDLQGLWTMYVFTHIFYVNFADVVPGLQICIMYSYVLASLFILYTYWILVWINRWTCTHWWNIFLGKKFKHVHRITRK